VLAAAALTARRGILTQGGINILVHRERMTTFVTLFIAADWGVLLNFKHPMATSTRNFQFPGKKTMGAWARSHNAKLRSRRLHCSVVADDILLLGGERRPWISRAARWLRKEEGS
jgi:hypothetical protein